MSLNRYAARADENQLRIVRALEGIGCSVHDLRTPVDLLVGLAGQSLLIEVKRPPGPRGGTSDRTHTPAQAKFLQSWRGGPVATVDSPEAAIRAILAVARRSDEQKLQLSTA